MLKFLFKRSKKSSESSSQKRIDLFQRPLNSFQSVSQEKHIPNQTLSFKEVESDVNEKIKVFQRYVDSVKEASLKLEELTKMLKAGEITEETYRQLIGELGSQLSVSIEGIFKLREALELDRAKAKLEWAKEKIQMDSLKIQDNMYVDEFSGRYSPVYRWEEITSKIDKVLSSLTIMEEVSILEQYLSLIKDSLGGISSKAEFKEGKELCKRRLNLILEKWASIRRGKMDELINLDLKASEIEEKINEIDVRFAVGEIDRGTYESKISVLQGSLKNVRKEISEIRSLIDSVDMKIFRCQELLREIL